VRNLARSSADRLRAEGQRTGGLNPPPPGGFNLLTMGTHDMSGLGDIKDYWNYPSGPHRLQPGESAVLDRVWVFDVCWKGDGEPRQCRATGVDVFPR
jgi:hypothetical protein